MFSKQKQIILNSDIAHSNSNFLSAVNSHEMNHISNFIGSGCNESLLICMKLNFFLDLLPYMHHHPSLIHLCMCEQGDKLI